MAWWIFFFNCRIVLVEAKNGKNLWPWCLDLLKNCIRTEGTEELLLICAVVLCTCINCTVWQRKNSKEKKDNKSDNGHKFSLPARPVSECLLDTPTDFTVPKKYRKNVTKIKFLRMPCLFLTAVPDTIYRLVEHCTAAVSPHCFCKNQRHGKVTASMYSGNVTVQFWTWSGILPNWAEHLARWVIKENVQEVS